MAYKQTPALIADAFSSAFRQKQQQAQRDREFRQSMAEKQRQFGLLQYWRNQNLAETKRYHDAQIANMETDNTRSQSMLDQNKEKLKFEKEKEIFDQGQAKKKSLLEEKRVNETIKHNRAMEGIYSDKTDKANKAKKPKLSSTIAKNIAVLKDVDGQSTDFEKSEASEKIKLEAFKGYGRAYNFVNNIEKIWGRPLSPRELAEETIKHLQGGGLTNEDAAAIENYLNYYEQVYKKPEKAKGGLFGLGVLGL